MGVLTHPYTPCTFEAEAEKKMLLIQDCHDLASNTKKHEAGQMLTGLKLLLLKNETLSADLSLHVKELACAYNPTGNPSAVAAEGPRTSWLLAPTFCLKGIRKKVAEHY